MPSSASIPPGEHRDDGGHPEVLLLDPVAAQHQDRGVGAQEDQEQQQHDGRADGDEAGLAGGDRVAAGASAEGLAAVRVLGHRPGCDARRDPHPGRQWHTGPTAPPG